MLPMSFFVTSSIQKRGKVKVTAVSIQVNDWSLHAEFH